MSVRTVNWVNHHSPVVGAARYLLTLLAWHETDEGCWPSTTTLAHETAMDRSNVFRLLNKLEEQHAIKIERQGGGRGRSNRYQILTETVSECHQSCCTNDVTTTPSTTDKRCQNGVTPQQNVVTTPTDRKERRTNYRARARTHEPEPPAAGPKGPPAPTIQPIERCTRCDRLTFDCLCFDGPQRTPNCGSA